jgi:hypothetical protein
MALGASSEKNLMSFSKLGESTAPTGVLYAATGEKYRKECIRSLKSLAKNLPGMLVTVFTDEPMDFVNIDRDKVTIRPLLNPQRGFIDKISALMESPYQRTLFLDTDTIVLSEIKDLIRLGDYFDMAVVSDTYLAGHHPLIPRSFPEFNTGVILFNKTPEVISMMTAWKQTFISQMRSENPPKHDQPSFRESLFFSPVRLVTLSNEWNFHAQHPKILNAGSSVKILHTRRCDDELSSAVFETAGHSRIFIPSEDTFHPSRINGVGRYFDLTVRVWCAPYQGICIIRHLVHKLFSWVLLQKKR